MAKPPEEVTVIGLSSTLDPETEYWRGEKFNKHLDNKGINVVDFEICGGCSSLLCFLLSMVSVWDLREMIEANNLEVRASSEPLILSRIWCCSN